MIELIFKTSTLSIFCNYSVESNNEQLDLKFATGSDRF